MKIQKILNYEGQCKKNFLQCKKEKMKILFKGCATFLDLSTYENI